MSYRRIIIAFLSFLLLSIDSTVHADPTPVPAIAARAYILIDANSGQTLTQLEGDSRIEPASLTKLMTAYLVFSELRAGKIGMDTEAIVSNKAWRMEGSRTFLEVGKKIPVETLLKGMIIQSGNDATVTLAELIGGSEDAFVSMMNQQVQALGMRNTHYANSAGLPDPEHYSTARDIALLTRALIRNFPEYYRFYSMREFTYNGITQYNRNKLLWSDAGVDGVKTGHTETAGFCLVASGTSGAMRLISVVLGTRSENARAEESQKLLGWGFRSFESHRLYAANQTLTQTRIFKGSQDQLPLGLSEDLYITIPKGQYGKLSASMSVKSKITAPASKGQAFGIVSIKLNGGNLTQRPLTALLDVTEGNVFQRMIDGIKLWF